MDDSAKTDALVERFGKLTPEIAGEFLSMLRLYALDEDELFYKWESYCINMGSESTKLNLDTVLTFKKDVQEKLEKSMRTKSRQQNSSTSKSMQRTPRHGKNSGDPRALIDELVGTPPRGANGSIKRKFEKPSYDTPSKSTRLSTIASPGDNLLSSPIRKPFETLSIDAPSTPFSARTNAGSTVEVLNPHIARPTLPLPDAALTADRTARDNRVKLVANQDIKRFSYRPMHQKLSESSEVYDDRIEEFAADIAAHHNLPPTAFGNPATSDPDEIIAVGRIASDALNSSLNAASVVLETSRRMGGGARVPLKLDALPSWSFFPGQIVAVRGVNASGYYFAVRELLTIPRLPVAFSPVSKITAAASQLAAGPMNIIIAAGPYTTSDNLLFEALDEICQKAATTCPDVLILLGPFIDADHPLIASGDFTTEREDGTIEDLFRERISRKIKKATRSMIIMIPSTRDVVSKHVSFPQEPLKRKFLDLPPNVKCLPNPSLLSLNDTVFALSTHDILHALSRTEIRHNPSEHHPFARLCNAVISQRSFYPLCPAAEGQNVDVPNLRLADFLRVTPDVMVLASVIGAAARVVDGVVCVNPGGAAKGKGGGTTVWMTVEAGKGVGAEVVDGELVAAHRVFERARVDVVRI